MDENIYLSVNALPEPNSELKPSSLLRILSMAMNQVEVKHLTKYIMPLGFIFLYSHLFYLCNFVDLSKLLILC